LFINLTRKYLDFIGLNYYFHRQVKIGFNKPLQWFVEDKNKQLSDMGWEIYPKGIYYVLKELKKYNLPIYITENGVADEEDRLRRQFIAEHLFWTHKAISDGIDVRGYFYWSLMDNFEWDKGFMPKFGLLKIDKKTLERVPQKSAFFYAKISKGNGFKYA
ncbi:family 1 glycosylhydrolase, partial [bacterium]|nr:family 1 glycosylhydrolase [bacterium]